MSNDKKARERALLDAFLKHSGAYPNAKLVDNERPDFLLDFEGRRIGIEMTEYFQGKRGAGGSEKRKAEAICESLRRRIRDAFRSEAHLADLERRTGLLRLKTHGANLGAEEEAFISEFAALVKANRKEVKYQHYELDKHPTLAKWVQRVWINEAKGVWMTDPWGCVECGAGSVGITEDELVAALSAKKDLAAAYKEAGRCHSVVLLICAGGGLRLSECSGDGENLAELISKVRPVMATLGFDEIHFYSRDGDWTRRLHP